MALTNEALNLARLFAENRGYLPRLKSDVGGAIVIIDRMENNADFYALLSAGQKGAITALKDKLNSILTVIES